MGQSNSLYSRPGRNKAGMSLVACVGYSDYWGGLIVCVLRRFIHVRLFDTLWTVAHQAPMSMKFSRQEYWSGLPCPPPGDLPESGIRSMSLTYPVQVWAGLFRAKKK